MTRIRTWEGGVIARGYDWRSENAEEAPSWHTVKLIWQENALSEKLSSGEGVHEHDMAKDHGEDGHLWRRFPAHIEDAKEEFSDEESLYEVEARMASMETGKMEKQVNRVGSIPISCRNCFLLTAI